MTPIPPEKSPKIETHFTSSTEIEVFVAQFRDCTLPCERWSHRAHLVVGLWFCLHYNDDDTLDLLRDHIQRYNTACGVPNSTTRGYHETITHFYVWLIRQYLNKADTTQPLLTLLQGLIARHGSAEAPYEYWSRAVLWSPTARAHWVEPDIKPLKIT
jgi:hypothetical protein